MKFEARFEEGLWLYMEALRVVGSDWGSSGREPDPRRWANNSGTPAGRYYNLKTAMRNIEV
jgi:hypothetical protein